MKLILLYVGKTDEGYLTEGMAKYIDRLKHYLPVEEKVIREEKVWKKMSVPDRKAAEANAILKAIRPSDAVVLLDENGRSMDSQGFAGYLQKHMSSGVKQVVFVVGGAYGFDREFLKKYPQSFSLSKMTFSHRMVRLFLVEQIYRAMTILNNEPYHNT